MISMIAKFPHGSVQQNDVLDAFSQNRENVITFKDSEVYKRWIGKLTYSQIIDKEFYALIKHFCGKEYYKRSFKTHYQYSN